MSQSFDARRLDIVPFASERGALADAVQLADFPRLQRETVEGAADTSVAIDWQAQGEMRRDAGLDDGVARPALHLRAQARLPLVCQRCLQPVWMEVAVDRRFLFAPDEAQAARLDECAENDMLALTGDFDLFGLIEDELLLALPFAPRHERCSRALPAQDAGLEAAADKPRPFAVLAALKKPKQADNL